MILLLLLLLVARSARACPASIWSPMLPQSQHETAPQKQCWEMSTNEMECQTNNLCCYVANTRQCIPSNAQFVECPVASSSRPACEALGSNNCWFDGTMCRRVCPFTTNVNLLCMVLGTLSTQRTAAPIAATTRSPTLVPTRAPSRLPTYLPTTSVPSRTPTFSRPTFSPTFPPLDDDGTPVVTRAPVTSSNRPTHTPTTVRPTAKITSQPTIKVTTRPTVKVTVKPTVKVTTKPSTKPTVLNPNLSERPTLAPIRKPTYRITLAPGTTKSPTSKPTKRPTLEPTSKPTKIATEKPTKKQTDSPTKKPTAPPISTTQPTKKATPSPSAKPTKLPTIGPTVAPTLRPTSLQPTRKETLTPTKKPSKAPTEPTLQPTKRPTAQPSAKPTKRPSVEPTKRPTVEPTKRPTVEPTAKPTLQAVLPSAKPTDSSPKDPPTNSPSFSTTLPPTLALFTMVPSAKATNKPTVKPTNKPTAKPTKKPTTEPTQKPTKKPTAMPTKKSTLPPTNKPGIFWSPVLANNKEANPTVACEAMQDEDTCAQRNYCCWHDTFCFAPTEVRGIECALITDPTVCSVVWKKDCEWNGNRCQRLQPEVSASKPASAVCDALFHSHALMQQTRYKSFDSLATTSNETLVAEKSTAVNPTNQYCWSKANNQPCKFPFQYQKQTYNDCIADAYGTPQCMTAAGMMKCTCTAKQRKRSVLVISMDDFRPEMNVAYGRKSSLTPVLDKFARRPGTVVFDRAYTQFSWCAPSRDSYMSGLLPETTQSVSFAGTGLKGTPFRDKIKTIPELFKDAGYWTAGGGKVFHLGRDDPKSWNEYYSDNVGQNSACLTDNKATRFQMFDGSRTSLGCSTSNYQAILDTPVMQGAMDTLQRIVQLEQEPFYLSVGLFKPHMPYHVHNVFWSKFSSSMNEYENVDKFAAPAPRDSYVDALTFDLTSSEFGKTWGSDPNEDKSVKSKAHFRSLMRRGYQAAVYQTDDMIGQILNKLDDLALRQSTLVVLHSDHGFHLGENNAFAKQTNFEIATRVPVIFHVPWFRPAGSPASSSLEDLLNTPTETREDVLPGNAEIRRNGEFFELLDLMPTIAGLMNVPKPKYYEGSDQSGQVALAALAALAASGTPPKLANRKTAAFSQVMRCVLADCSYAALEDVYAMSYSVRTDKWRYTAHMPAPGGMVQWGTSKPLAEELYDHSNDDDTMLAYDDATHGALYGEMEMTNLATSNKEVCAQLFKLLIEKYNTNKNMLLLAS